jgi:hypothetical protein
MPNSSFIIIWELFGEEEIRVSSNSGIGLAVYLENRFRVATAATDIRGRQEFVIRQESPIIDSRHRVRYLPELDSSTSE